MRGVVLFFTGALGLIALAGGGASLVGGLSGFASLMGYPLDPSGAGEGYAIADSEFRYFAGVWVGVGLSLLYCLGDIAGRTAVFRVAMLGVFIGGVGRLISLSQVGAPPEVYGPIAIELILPPVLIALQSRFRSVLPS